MKHIYRVNEGSRFAPLQRGPLLYQGVALDLSSATVRVQIARGSTVIIDWDSADAVATGSADGVLSWVMPETAMANGTYQLWWRFQRSGEGAMVIGPDTLQIRDVP